MPLMLKLNGRDYDLPSLEDLTLDETILLERYAGQTIDQIETTEHVPLGAVKALAIIGILRVDQTATEREAAEAVGRLRLAELRDSFKIEQEGGEEAPPTNGNAEPSDGSGLPEHSGETSSDAGEPSPDGQHLRPLSGTPPSGASDSDRATSAA